ncbi:MAG: hypothetical protein ACR2O8_00800 [Rhizobiaceae bacterium]
MANYSSAFELNMREIEVMEQENSVMTDYNKFFELNPRDMEVIETALRAAETRDQSGPLNSRCIHDVLGKLHNQKRFYRPKDAVYVSG